jgi:hypothetical protein
MIYFILINNQIQAYFHEKKIVFEIKCGALRALKIVEYGPLLRQDVCVSLDLEASYEETCRLLRFALRADRAGERRK